MSDSDGGPPKRAPEDRLWLLGVAAALAWAVGFAAREVVRLTAATWVTRLSDGVIALSIGIYLFVAVRRRCPECGTRVGVARQCPSCAGFGRQEMNVRRRT